MSFSWYDRHNKSRSGFTLIELLVVVLIIGLLSAAALPQYEKAVWKSRATEMMTWVKNVGEAQDIFYLANGEWARSFSDLDIDYSALAGLTKPSPCAMGATGAAGAREKDFMTLTLNLVNGNYAVSGAAFNEGPYTCSGFVYVHQSRDVNIPASRVYCWQYKTGLPGFCEQLFSGRRVGHISGWDVFEF